MKVSKNFEDEGDLVGIMNMFLSHFGVGSGMAVFAILRGQFLIDSTVSPASFLSGIHTVVHNVVAPCEITTVIFREEPGRPDSPGIWDKIVFRDIDPDTEKDPGPWVVEIERFHNEQEALAT